MARPSQAIRRPIHEPDLRREDRRARGIYYTPPEVAAFLAERTLAAWRPAEGRAPRVLDLACGAGALLKAIAAELAQRGSHPAQLVGLDRDAAVLAAAQQELAGFEPHLRAEDGLLSDHLQPGRFDLIVGNPPYVSIRQAGKDLSSTDRALLASRFRFARGHYDLYLLFLERALELLAPGGGLGFIVPDKFGSAAYALACRQKLLSETTLLEVYDLGEEKLFRRAAVYPWLLVLRKELPDASHAVRFSRWQGNGPAVSVLRPQRQILPDAFSFSRTLNVEEFSPTATLETRCTLGCGATGYRASRLADLIREHEEMPVETATRPFIVSGCIDPFVIKTKQVRFQGRKYIQPVLNHNAGLSAHQRALFARRKLVIAGLAQRLEVAWDSIGRAIGVQVFAAYDLVDDPFYLLGLLNSQLLSAIYRERFAARRLAGGYLTFNKGPLSKLPIRLLDQATSAERRHAQTLCAAAKELHELGLQSDQSLLDARRTELTAEIDGAALCLYRVDGHEMTRVPISPPIAA